MSALITGSFAFDTITVPNKEDNPWNSWMRLGGFDFFQKNFPAKFFLSNSSLISPR